MKEHKNFNIDSLLANLFMMVAVLEFFFDKNGNMEFWSFRYIFPVIIIVKGLISVKFNIRFPKKIFIFFSTWFICSIVNFAYNGNLSLASIFIEICYIVIAYTLVKYPEDWRYIECLVNLIHIWAFISIFILKDIGIGMSSNYMSVYYLILFSILAYQKSQVGLSIAWFHPFVAFVFSVFAQGRGGIISLLALNIMLFSFRQKSREKTLFYFITGQIMLIIVFLIFESGISIGGILTRFQEMGINSNGRFRFWMNYIDACGDSLFNILFGVNIQEHLSHYMYYIPDHLHNSFLTYYGMHGLFISIIIVIYIYIFCKNNIKCKNIMLICYVTSFFIRAFTDIVFGNYVGDIVIYMIIIIVLCSNKYKERNTISKA